MPSECFLNLPEEKRRRILTAAQDELTRVTYDELSINRIVKEAGIPRGSFYTYFQGKDDLVEYMMGDYCRMLEHMLDRMFQAGNADVFDAARQAVVSTLAFCGQDGQETLYRNLFSCMRINPRFSFERMLYNDRTFVELCLPYASRSGLQDASDGGVAVLLDLLIGLVRNTVARIFAEPERREKHLADFETKLAIIRGGAIWGAQGQAFYGEEEKCQNLA